jgi:hypothetical protein
VQGCREQIGRGERGEGRGERGEGRGRVRAGVEVEGKSAEATCEHDRWLLWARAGVRGWAHVANACAAVAAKGSLCLLHALGVPCKRHMHIRWLPPPPNRRHDHECMVWVPNLYTGPPPTVGGTRSRRRMVRRQHAATVTATATAAVRRSHTPPWDYQRPCRADDGRSQRPRAQMQDMPWLSRWVETEGGGGRGRQIHSSGAK